MTVSLDALAIPADVEDRARTNQSSFTAQETKHALVYVRVSTKEQAERDGDPEGYSIPAQRDACHRKAEALEATVVEELSTVARAPAPLPGRPCRRCSGS